MKKIERAHIGADDMAILQSSWLAFKCDAECRLPFKAKFDEGITTSDLCIIKCENPEVRTHFSPLVFAYHNSY